MYNKSLPLHYRYYESMNENGVFINVDKYLPLSETPFGYWVIREYFFSQAYGFFNTQRAEEYVKKHRRWVSKTATRKYCHQSKIEAMKSFVKRKESHLWRLNYSKMSAEASLEKAQMYLDSVKAGGLLECDLISEGTIYCGQPVGFDEINWLDC